MNTPVLKRTYESGLVQFVDVCFQFSVWIETTHPRGPCPLCGRGGCPGSFDNESSGFTWTRIRLFPRCAICR